MLSKVTDPEKMVTDTAVLRHLAINGIDKDYVEFTDDYVKNPFAKGYYDRQSGNGILVSSGLPMRRKTDGTKIVPGWEKSGNKLYVKNNLFEGYAEDGRVALSALNDQPDGIKANDEITWNPKLFIGASQIDPVPGVTILETDPVNPKLHNNTVEWDYGVCKRRIRILQGRFKETWVFTSKPFNNIRIVHNQESKRLRLGKGYDANLLDLPITVKDDDAELLDVSDLIYPITVGGSGTFYPDANPESTSVDGYVARYVAAGEAWGDLRTGAGTLAGDTLAELYQTLIVCDDENDKYRQITRCILLFDTSAIGSGNQVDSATFSLYGTAKLDNASITPDLCLVSSNPASNTSLAASDYGTLGSTLFCDAVVTYAAWDTSDYNDFALNSSGIAAVTVTGVSKFGVRNKNYDFDGSAPAWSSTNDSYLKAYHADQGSDKPKLVVSYSATGIPTLSDYYNRRRRA